ncbi:N-6 DNA methylase [Rhizobium sp. PP-F2F-G48]|uniref:type ISP restriction/modification enzyme n=1 Tax=Rhizobium sp. PP-F2F-G48 TaxID=2135651 RepID=UPI001046DAEE|nr:type ISP restriction/modification enzyme [Rhizobium sp. PP-F2F-G48]TCM52596.1 N-6 DNA methylase [Rhizobium sp. PP-F2F-G48]
MIVEDRILAAYLSEIARVRATAAGTAETSYYGALQGAFNTIGSELQPHVYCLSQLSGGSAGFPDFGLFVEQQVSRGQPLNWRNGGPSPERGVIEADDVPASLGIKRGSQQVTNYLSAYGLVLITNFRDFELLEAGSTGPQVVEHFSFGRDVNAFFAWAAQSRRSEDAPIAMAFTEFFRRAMLRRAPLAEPRDVAALLASYAREGLARVTISSALPSLSALRDALGSSLGLNFEPGPKGDRFFRSTLVQTLFYGLFSAWASHARSSSTPFDWRTTAWGLHVPAVRSLFEQLATPGRLGALGLVEVIGWAADALNRIDRSAFFGRFDQAEAVQHFYEPFLAAYDPDLRKALGVWYTPGEVVRYMVERVDRSLRTELGIADGLADPNVWVLDPCTGTGSFLIEVLRHIRRTLEAKGASATLGAELKDAAMRRVAGFEILPAPFVIAHWQVASLLAEVGATFDDDIGERAAIYLSNALTGWEAGSVNPHLPFPELERERDLANTVKQSSPVLVVIGNPPYSAFDGTSPNPEGDLVAPYKVGLRERWRVRKFNLDELYVRFFRVAERRIADVTGRGIVCLITNSSYLGYRSFTVMRERLVTAFDHISIDALHGDSRQTGKLTPDGLPDPSVFSTDFNPEGIRVGTAIATLVRRDSSEPKKAQVFHRDFWGSAKRQNLEATLAMDMQQFVDSYTPSNPSVDNRFKLAPDTTLAVYRAWPSLAELSESDEGSGLLEKRKGALLALEEGTIRNRMERYEDPAVSFETLRSENIGPVIDAAGFNARTARARFLASGGVSSGRFAEMMEHPFDRRWVFYTDAAPLWNRSRPGLAAQQAAGNRFIVTRVQSRKAGEGIPVFFTSDLPGDHLFDPNARPFPVKRILDALPGSGGLALHGGDIVPNLSNRAREYLDGIGAASWLAAGHSQLDALWYHSLAVAYAPAWLDENEEGIVDDWPRIPLPTSVTVLESSVALGRHVANLLDPSQPVDGVTTGAIWPVLRHIAVLERLGGGSAAGIDFAMTARWGARDSRGAVMPGPGRIDQRAYAEGELPSSAELTTLGETTNDVYLNEQIFWRNVPAEVWDFTIGGFQVLKKWLSYRSHAVIDRPLSLSEVNYFRDTARRLATLRLMAGELDANYQACAEASWPWRTVSSVET